MYTYNGNVNKEYNWKVLISLFSIFYHKLSLRMKVVKATKNKAL